MANFGRSVGAASCLAVAVLCLLSTSVAADPRGPLGPHGHHGRGQWFDRMYVLIFENNNFSVALADPNFNKWAAQGRLLTNYHGVAHPSEPNYLATTAGTTFGIHDDGAYNFTAPNLADLLEDRDVSWKNYNENYTGVCNLATGIGSGKCPNTVNTKITTFYARKHNPFISYTSVNTNPEVCAKIVPSQQLAQDIADDAVPEFNYYVPNQCNDAHDTNITYAGQWLDQFMTSTFSQDNAILGRTLVVITFDEDHTTNVNSIYTVLVPFGYMDIEPGSSDDTFYTHYSLLRTVEDNWRLGTLGTNDTTATPFFS